MVRSIFQAEFFQKYLLPGFIFQSVVIGGGYGTGRELVEFFMPYGPLGGLLAMVLVSAVIWSVVCAVTFAFARVFEAYDYRTFFKHLLGRGWLLYEVLYFIFLILILGVIAAAAGAILEETFDVPYALGVVGMMALVGFLTFRGTALIEGFLARWSFVLYAVYVVFVIWAFSRFGDAILSSFSMENLGFGWITGGVEYAAYNLAVIPPILFCVRHIGRKSEAVVAGLLAGPIAMTPAVLFYVSMLGQYPQIVDQPVPANYMLGVFGSRVFQVSFQIVLFGTLIETGTGMIHGLNERIAGVYAETSKQMPSFLRPLVAVGLLIVGALLAQFGIISLIARGYGTITWFFLAVFVIPILTIGVWKLMGSTRVGLSGANGPATD